MTSWQSYRSQARNVLASYVERPTALLLEKAGLSPNKLTAIGLLFSVATAYFLSIGQFVSGAILLLVASSLDMADGALARLRNKATATGALLDSTADRISEAVVFLGLLVFYVKPISEIHISMIFLALFGSFMVSYLRARGEGLGVDCKIGVMTRPERVIVLAAGLMVHQTAIALSIIIVLSVLTSIHRFWHIHKELSQQQSVK